MTAHVPIPPRTACDIATGAQIEDAIQVIADFAEAGVVKGYARLQETRYSDGRTEEVRDARISRATWRRIIGEDKVADVVSGTVRLAGSPELGGGPKVNLVGIRFDEPSVDEMVRQHGRHPNGGATPTPEPSPSPTGGSPSSAEHAAADDDIKAPPRAAQTRKAATLSPDAEVLTIDQAAVALGIGRTKIYAMAAAGELTITKIGKRSVIRREEIDRILGKSRD